jgi:hypothetical protein
MRFMMIMYPGEQAQAQGWEPDVEAVGAMTKFNEEMSKAGVMLAGEGLHSPAKGAHVSYSGGKPTVTDGPFAEAKEVVGGFWLIQASSREEALEWAKRVPGSDHEVVEVRQVFDIEDFPPEVQEAAKF